MSESVSGEERAGPGSGKRPAATEEERLKAFRELRRLDEDPVWEWNKKLLLAASQEATGETPSMFRLHQVRHHG